MYRLICKVIGEVVNVKIATQLKDILGKPSPIDLQIELREQLTWANQAIYCYHSCVPYTPSLTAFDMVHMAV